MDAGDLFTAKSIEAVRRRRADASGPARKLFDDYVADREAQLESAPQLQRWIASLEDGDLAAAADPALWASLVGQGFITCPAQPTPYPDHGKFVFTLISPKVLDAFRSTGAPTATYAFTTVEVLLRREREIPEGVEVPDGWTDVAIVDTEFFELPPDVAPDNMDDREKIHVVYLAGLHEGRFVSKPVYIGVGTGEAYGVGPRQRATQGRFRFYRYDVKDSFQLEYIRLTERVPSEVKDATSLPVVTAITETRATLLLGRGAADPGFVCLSDPKLAEGYEVCFGKGTKLHLVLQEVCLEKMHDDLRTGRASTPFAADDVEAVLAFAWRAHRLFFAAWQHPLRLSEAEGLDLYYRQLPAFRRDEYELYRFKPELFGLQSGSPGADSLTVPAVLWSDGLRRQLEAAVPGAVEWVEGWLWREAVEDLYAYGNHPELRLCTAIALWRRLSDSGLWAAAVEAAYRGRLFAVSMAADRVCAGAQAG